MPFDPSTIRLLSPSFYAGDPHPAYAWLRDHAPLHYDEAGRVWGVSRFDDVIAFEKATDLYSSAQGSRPRTPADPSMINRDDPQHNDMRRVISARFTPRAVRRHERAVRARVTQLIDRVAREGKAEVVEDLAAPLPAMVINDWLGFPESNWTNAKRWAEVTMLAGGQHDANGDMDFFGVEGAQRALEEFSATVIEVAAKRRASPRDDLLSVWAHAEVGGRRMTDADIISEALLVLNGGAETTRAVIAATVVNLARNPRERAKLIANPGGMATAVEEFIRYVTPINNMRRTVVRTHERDGRTLEQGDEILLLYGAANRDPRRFPRPDEFDVERRPNQHLAFGFGTHFCLGASVARLEIRVMFEELLRRIPDFELAPGAELRFVPSVFTRAFEAVPIEFTPERG